MRKRRLPPKPQPLPYMTISDIRASGKPANPDQILPKDKQTICRAAIGALDDLCVKAPAIYRAITNASDNPLVFYDFGPPIGKKTVDYVQLAVILIDIGKTVEQVVAEIKRLDRKGADIQIAQGVYAPRS